MVNCKLQTCAGYIHCKIARNKISYNDLFCDVSKQKEAVSLFSDLIELKEEPTNPPGDKLAQALTVLSAVGMQDLLVQHVLIVFLSGINNNNPLGFWTKLVSRMADHSLPVG